MLLNLLLDNTLCSYESISEEIFNCDNTIYTMEAIKQLKSKVMRKTGIKIKTIYSTGYVLLTKIRKLDTYEE